MKYKIKFPRQNLKPTLKILSSFFIVNPTFKNFETLIDFIFQSFGFIEKLHKFLSSHVYPPPSYLSVVRKIPWRRAWQPTTVFLPGESHG